MENMYGTTILAVQKDGKIVVAGDGQVTIGDTSIKHNASKIRRLCDDKIVVGFAGAVGDAFALMERFEAKLKEYRTGLVRSAVELAKEWRLDKYLRQLQAMMIAADSEKILVLSGNGEVVEPDEGVAAIGSGSGYASAAARALIAHSDLDAEGIAREAMLIAADMCIYTNTTLTIEKVS